MNSKQRIVKLKHRKRKARNTQRRVEEIGNAKKKTLRSMNESGSLPKIYKDKI